ncbi:uncharacterized protein LOC115260788 [Aedes albopictus]|uniref:Uncharacterized protein n=1 Tax=Aedes albopictus TaxID=7160 RepID=A0ABM1YLC1_AEDAL
MESTSASANVARAGSSGSNSRPDSRIYHSSLTTSVATSRSRLSYAALRLMQLEEERAIQQREWQLEKRAMERERKAMQLQYKLLEEQLALRKRKSKGPTEPVGKTGITNTPTDETPSDESAENDSKHNSEAQEKSGKPPKMSKQPSKMMVPADQSTQDEIQQRSYSAILTTSPNEHIPTNSDCMDTIACNIIPFAISVTPPDLLTTSEFINVDINFAIFSLFLIAKGIESSVAVGVAVDHRLNRALSFQPPFHVAPEPPDPAPPHMQISVNSDAWTVNNFISENTINTLRFKFVQPAAVSALQTTVWPTTALAVVDTLIMIAIDTRSFPDHVPATSQPSCLQNKCLQLVLVEKQLLCLNLEMVPNTARLSTFGYWMSDTKKLPQMSDEWSANVYVKCLECRVEREKKRVSEVYVRCVGHCYRCGLGCNSSDHYGYNKRYFVGLVYQQHVAMGFADSDLTAHIRESIKTRMSRAVLQYKPSSSTVVQSSQYRHRYRSRSRSRRCLQSRVASIQHVFVRAGDTIIRFHHLKKKNLSKTSSILGDNRPYKTFRSLPFKRDISLRNLNDCIMIGETLSQKTNVRTINFTSGGVPNLIEALCSFDTLPLFPSVTMNASLTGMLMLQTIKDDCDTHNRINFCKLPVIDNNQNSAPASIGTPTVKVDYRITSASMINLVEQISIVEVLVCEGDICCSFDWNVYRKL